jgi:hypothetical protein
VPARARTDLGLKHYMAAAGSLAFLDLGGWRVTDAGLKELAGQEDLRVLNLQGTAVTDAGLKELSGLGSLQSLDLSRTKVTKEGVGRLAKELPKCRIRS